ncbi:MAG: Rid family detoxifying hydrolase [Mycoplasmoidaceae bacterium]|nr:Rid family detoxifying hydrolase [Mycoplasmoidaceae bacterium]
MKVISSKNAPAALGPYSQAIDTGNTLYVSGVLGIVPETGNLAGNSITEQTTQIFKNIDAILTTAGYAKETVVKCNVFLSDLDDFAACNKIYAEYFGEHKPARACVQAKMVKSAKVEIDVVAVK